ncbi:DNA mismatch repair protein MSH4-like isoform X1 [Musa acuminata AAA Group]|uniref:DNA mismatch repair protein MSH4 n=1 Tax=Musa acuminata subsp. malaccensis TaxID=214687 RepID=A0A804K439_MUSAM|nr:PREDICTED: DNA mismatch repair protein MSH4 isoform X1 [Musa acuminata subsp. malaccensis]
MEEEGGQRSSFAVGLIGNRAKEVGVAAFDLRSASLHLSQYIETSRSYQNTKTLLHFYDPMVIIVPPTKLSADHMVGVTELVDKYYASNKKVTLPRGCFDDTKGAVLVKSLAAKELSVLGLGTFHKQYYLCLAAAAATIKWIEAEKGVIVINRSLLVTFNGSFDHMNIDATSVQNLEIIDPLHSELWSTSNKKRSLFQMLKTTKTVGGARLLRANLLQPLKDIETINARLDCLDELMSNEELFFGLSQSLRKFPKETDKVLCRFCFKPKKVTEEVLRPANGRKIQILISDIIVLKTALDALPFLCKVLKDAKSLLLHNIYRTVCENKNYEGMRKRIGDVIDEDVAHARAPFIACTQQCFAIKSGIDGLLDVARRSFCDTSEAIHNLANKYREKFKLPNLKIPYNNRQGFYFSIPQKDISGKLPDKFIQVMKHGKNIHCSSFELASLNVRNKSAAVECFMRTEIFLEGLIDVIRNDISILTLLAEVLNLLDMIVNSFAHVISTKPVDRYTRPEFTDNGPVAIDAGRHPILESLHSDFVPNNLFLSEASNMVIVTGPNMSGKSTYLQQVCLIIILAQIGCYVPARFASLRVVDRIFTRIGTGDNVENNSSTFMTEMKETAFLMQNVSPKSLIVMDELGRATSSSDGFAIAWSCCEHLLSLNAYTIFATHMEGLSEMATIYPNVKILHFEVDLRNNRLDFKFHLKDGPRHVPHYGLLLAGVAGLPSSVVETARIITAKIAEEDVKRMDINREQFHSIQVAYQVVQKLICLKYSNQSEDYIRQALQNLKENFTNERSN